MRSGSFRAVVALAALVVSAASARAQAGKSLGVQDVNVAAEADIAAMPHMNAALAKELVGKRPFLSMTDLDAFLGTKLTKEQRGELYPKLFLLINLNTASREEILLVPGIGPRFLREFLEYRPYKSLAQWEREMGKYVKADEVARMGQYVFVPIDLNTATDEDILTLPGVGRRMVREFKEYRPWKTIEQFRREIGKYVDEKEVARLERFVEIR
jgi:DNA uptake protein ComE-like DNA-binding protein